MAFPAVRDREIARNVMLDAINAANALVPEIKSVEDQHEWRKMYDEVISAVPEDIRKLCHMLKRRNTKSSLN